MRARTNAVRVADGSKDDPWGETFCYPTVPAAHPKAIGSYQLAIWKRVKAGDGDQLADSMAIKRLLGGGAQEFVYEDDNVTGDAAAYTIAVIDPLGRTGALTRVDVVE